MSQHNRVVWAEGLFLRPQHFQQAERYFERLMNQRLESLAPYAAGFTKLGGSPGGTSLKFSALWASGSDVAASKA